MQPGNIAPSMRDKPRESKAELIGSFLSVSLMDSFITAIRTRRAILGRPERLSETVADRFCRDQGAQRVHSPADAPASLLTAH